MQAYVPPTRVTEALGAISSVPNVPFSILTGDPDKSIYPVIFPSPHIVTSGVPRP